MTTEFIGYTQAPVAELEAAFTGIYQQSMAELPFIYPGIPVKALGFQLFEQQWLGVMLTPWMISLLILPGPEQIWPERQVGQRIALKLPYADMTFTVGQAEGLSQYLACSIMSPLDKHLSIEQLTKLAADCAKMVLSLPLTEGQTAPEKSTVTSVSRRSLLTGLKSSVE